MPNLDDKKPFSFMDGGIVDADVVCDKNESNDNPLDCFRSDIIKEGLVFESNQEFLEDPRRTLDSIVDVSEVEVVNEDEFNDVGSVDFSCGDPRQIVKQITNRRLIQDMRSNDIKVRFLAHLEANYGLLETALKGARLSRKRFDKFMKEDPEFALSVNSMAKLDSELAVSTLYDLVERKNFQATKLLLDKKGHDYGFGDNSDQLVKKLLKELDEFKGVSNDKKSAIDMANDYKKYLKQGN